MTILEELAKQAKENPRGPSVGDIKEEEIDGHHIITVYAGQGHWRQVHKCSLKQVVTMPECRISGKTTLDIITEDYERRMAEMSK